MMPLIEANRLASFGLVVLIWLVQVIIYPAFAEISPDRFVSWHAGYTRAVTWVVAPLMLGQVALLAWLAFVRPSPASCSPPGWSPSPGSPPSLWRSQLHGTLQASGLDRAVGRGS
ncbi:MAG: hypothetical protein WKF75_05360 [Singulisphaera sp.]